ncbi:MAG: energy transducer TonB [Myxococcaceae bacterium]
MFDSVLGRTLGAPGRPAVGAAVSCGLHLLVLAVALHLSHPTDVSGLTFIPVHFPHGLQAGGLAERPKAAAATPTRRGSAMRPTTAGPTPAPAGEDAVSRPSAATNPGSGTAEGLGQNPASVGADSPCATPSCGAPLSEPPPRFLTPEMQVPQLVSGPEPRYPLAAALEHVGGNLLVRCTVTAEGEVKDCLVLKSLPYLDEPVLAALQARRYRPALLDGKPVSVRMVFPVRVLPP